MTDSPELRPARPRRRQSAPTTGDGADRLDRLEATVVEGLARLDHRLQADAAVDDRIEGVVELLEAAIDHLVAIERRLDEIQTSAPAPAPAKRSATAAKATKAAGAGRSRARRTKEQDIGKDA